MRHARWCEVDEYVWGVPTSALVIWDCCDHRHHLTITNDAEYVVETLCRTGTLKPGERLFYYDSCDELGEIVVQDGKFAGFAPGPRP